VWLVEGDGGSGDVPLSGVFVQMCDCAVVFWVCAE
jgi:hypothetical protein